MSSDSEIIRVIRHMFDSKYELITYLKQLDIIVPERSSYGQILGFIRETGNEEKFAQAIFHTRDLESGIRAGEFLQGLSTLTLLDLKALGQELSEHEKAWKFRKTPKAAVVREITRNCSPSQIDRAIRKLVASGEIGFYQTGKWIIGPLGMSKSVQERDTYDVSIMDFLEAYFDEEASKAFLDKSDLRSKATKQATKLSTDAMHQLILTHCTNGQFIATANALVSAGSLRIPSYEDYSDFCSFPAGLFERDYSVDPILVLADLLLRYLGEDDVKRDFNLSEGGLKQKLLAKLLLEKLDPRKVLNDLFGLGQLKRVAEDLGLVAVRNIVDKQKLIEFLMFRIGFNIPRAPRGISQRLSSIDETLKVFRNESPAIQKGMVTSAFVDLEGIIKDLVCFYSLAFWEAEISEVASTEEIGKLEAIEELLTKKFPAIGRIKPLHKLTLGQLKVVLFALDAEGHNDCQVAGEMRSMLSRETILTMEQRNSLDSVSKTRPKFAHDVPQSIESEDCLTAMVLIRKILQSFVDEGTYPIPITVTKEVTNEYGVSYFEGIDEFNSKWVIKATDFWIHLGSYLMKGGELHVAIDPVIVERFWSKY